MKVVNEPALHSRYKFLLFTMFVLDCSAAVAFVFKDEVSERSEELLYRVKSEGAVVPSIWLLEIGNVLVQAERKRRITNAQLHSYLQSLMKLPISVDTESQGKRRLLSEVLMLAREQTLTTYDAAYLELSIRRGIELATRDKALLRAARRVGAGKILICGRCSLTGHYESAPQEFRVANPLPLAPLS